VYSTALRKTGNPHSAEEITQAVFIILARKAGQLRRSTIISGWLYQTTRLTAANFLRTDMRRAQREQEVYMQSSFSHSEPDNWPEVAPILEDAMGELGETDRTAVVLRFFEKKSFQEVGAAFGGTENAAKKRVARALEQLRRSLGKRGVISSSAVLTTSLLAHSVHGAPATLTKTVAAIAATKGATASASGLALVKGTMKMMTWLRYKAAVGFTGAALLTGATVWTVAQSSAGNSTITPVEAQQTIANPPAVAPAVIPAAANDQLSPSNILINVRLAYANLSTYRDTGWTVHNYGTFSRTNTFTEILGTRTCYRVDVITDAHPFSDTNRYFSDGLDGYQQLLSSTVFYHRDLASNLASVYDETALPAIYFRLNWGNVMEPFGRGSRADVVRKPDESVGSVDCYVIANTATNYPVTLWVGKQDFLIRRCRHLSRLETHENISTNETFSREDYIPVDPDGKPVISGIRL
jgi:RNA polymerase sigma factor (sigma-70 family)